MALAWVVFRENVDRRLLAGAAAILAGARALSWQGGRGGARLGRARYRRRLPGLGDRQQPDPQDRAADPVQIAMIKGLCGRGGEP